MALDALVDGVLLAGRGACDAAAFAWRSLGVSGWVSLALPALLIDAPRLVLAPIALGVVDAFGLGRRRAAREAAFAATRPRVSVVIAGYNERSSIESTIRTLLELEPPADEIIVVDDNSEDGMYGRAAPYAANGRIRLVKNAAASGRGGKPAAVNLGMRLATGAIIVVMDADCSFDRDLLAHLVPPFADPRVGVVAANVAVRNARASFWTAMQAIEYLVSISVGKRWLDLFGMNFIASGACGAFRRDALARVGGCDVETAEDLDNSLKAVKAGWRVAFARRAIVMTDAPEALRTLVRQRIRWDRDLVRVAFRKHAALVDLWRRAPRVWLQLVLRWVAVVGGTYAYVAWLAWLVTQRGPAVAVLAVAAGAAFSLALLLPTLVYAVLTSARPRDDARLIALAPLFPFYSEAIFRWVRVWAHTLEYLRLNQEDPYLPQSAWRNMPRW